MQSVVSIFGNLTKNNIVIGNGSANQTMTGSDNVVIGYETSVNLTTGGNNIILGNNSSRILTTGSNNVSIGQLSLGSGNYSGSQNVAIGYQAGNEAYNIGNSTFIGYNADVSTTDDTVYNELTLIGAGCSPIVFGQSNQLCLGNSLTAVVCPVAGSFSIPYSTLDALTDLPTSTVVPPGSIMMALVSGSTYLCMNCQTVAGAAPIWVYFQATAVG
jgi:hypothetical protein